MAWSRRSILRNASALGVSTALGCRSADGTGDGDEGTADGTADDSGSTGGSSSGADSSSTGGDGLPTYEYDGEPGPEDLFQHAVASGDPLPDAVILWTRVTGAPEGAVEAFYEIAIDPEFTMRIAADYVDADPDRDYTIKLDATGLDAGTTYYYRFFALGRVSPVGRTRTAPTGEVDRLRFAVVSCSSLAHGYFHSYSRVAERADLDVVIHLGDYIYEYGNAEYGDLRTYEPAYEITTLADYRTRHAQYRRDVDLQACARQHAMIAIWDDHEVADNSYSDGAENHDEATEGPYADRKAAAYQAYVEWMPIREREAGIVYRSFAFGDLVHLMLLDTRIVGREAQATSGDDPALMDPDRQLLGETQEAWLAQELESPAQWKLLGQQVMMAQLRLTPDAGPLNLDQWDGYPAARQRLYDLLREHSPANNVVLTGDIHSSWAFELADDPFSADYDPSTGAGAVAVELVVPAVSSPGFPSNGAASFLATLPHMKWGNLVERGYVVLDITTDRVQASWWLVDDVTVPTGGAESAGAAWSIADGVVQLVEDAEPAAARDDAPLPAP